MGWRPGAGIGEPLGQGVQLVAAVEPPSEAGKVALGVLGADVMVGAGEGGLDVAQRRVDPSEGCPFGGLRATAGDHREVRAAGRLDRRPARQAVADHIAAGGEVALGERLDLALAEALDDRQAQPPGLALRGRLDRRHERRLAGRAPAPLAARPRAAEIGVVDLDPTRELGLLRLARLHRRHQLVLDQPGGRLPRAEPARQLDRAHPALALAQVVDRQKPGGQRQLGPMEHGARGQPDLALAAVALVERPALQLGAAAVAAARAGPALAPAQPIECRPACLLRPVALPELGLAQALHPPPQPALSAHHTPVEPTKPAQNLAQSWRIVMDDQVKLNYLVDLANESV